jgi:hypothetical protein
MPSAFYSQKIEIMKNTRLQFTDLAPYFPYGLRVKYKEGVHYGICEISGLDLLGAKILGIDIWVLFKNLKPILRPFSDLINEIELNGKKFVPKDILDETHISNWTYGNIKYVNSEMLKDAPFWFVEKLIEWQFDVFGLIDKGLAISIHDVEQAEA